MPISSVVSRDALSLYMHKGSEMVPYTDIRDKIKREASRFLREHRQRLIRDDQAFSDSMRRYCMKRACLQKLEKSYMSQVRNLLRINEGIDNIRRSLRDLNKHRTNKSHRLEVGLMIKELFEALKVGQKEEQRLLEQIQDIADEITKLSHL